MSSESPEEAGAGEGPEELQSAGTWVQTSACTWRASPVGQ